MIKKKSYNGMLAFGITAIVIGAVILMYSIASYSEIRLLSDKIDFESIDNNNQIPASEKYYKYISVWDMLMSKLEKNKNLPYKNMSCAYLDYAQHDIKSMYKIVYKGANDDLSKRESVRKNIQKLSDIYKYYNNCRKTALYSEELSNMLKESQNSGNVLSNERMENFLNGDKYNKDLNGLILTEDQTDDEELSQYQYAEQFQDEKQHNPDSSFTLSDNSDNADYKKVKPYVTSEKEQN